MPSTSSRDLQATPRGYCIAPRSRRKVRRCRYRYPTNLVADADVQPVKKAWRNLKLQRPI